MLEETFRRGEAYKQEVLGAEPFLRWFHLGNHKRANSSWENEDPLFLIWLLCIHRDWKREGGKRIAKTIFEGSYARLLSSHPMTVLEL